MALTFITLSDLERHIDSLKALEIIYFEKWSLY